MPETGRRLFLLKVLVLAVSLNPFCFDICPQDSASKVSELKINEKQPVSPGKIIASCVVEEKGDIPFRRYALIYISFENGSVKMLLEKTVVQWGGWGWSELSWFSPMTEKKSCRLPSVGSECTVSLAPKTDLKLTLIDQTGNISVKKLIKLAF